MKNVNTTKIGNLWNELSKKYNVIYKGSYEVIQCQNIKIRTIHNTFKTLRCISRHFTTKNKIRIFHDISNYVDVTADHVCMILMRDMLIENVSAKYLKVGMSILVYDNATDKEIIKSIYNIEILPPYNDYVYDVEVDDPDHAFYANNVLIHNSQFLNLEPFTKKYAEKFNIEPNLLKFTRTQFKELSKEIDDFVENKVNDFVKNLVNSECHTTKGHHIRYGREYIASEGMFFRKKHYLVHIIDDEGNKVDKFKYSGIAVKKTALPSEMKPLLKHIYEHTCIDRWTFTEYRSYLNEIFDKFKQYPFETIALNQSYNTEKQVTGYLTSEKGTQAAVRGAHYYNHMLKEFNLEHQYDQIMLGDVIHYAYIYNNNPYNIDVIAYKNKLPDIFKDVFKINYELMFEKLFVDTLKGYVEAMNFSKYQPANQMETDIFTL